MYLFQARHANTITPWIVGRLGRGHAIFAIVLFCAVAFAVYPIAALVAAILGSF